MLDELLQTIETLQKRIEEHSQVLRENEIRTRYALVDPLLGALGWDVSDPAQVVPEFDIAKKRADYALLGANGKPAAMVEAKKLDRPLEDGLEQSIGYCVGKGTPYFCVTDGRRWALYETFRPVEINEKLVNRFDLVSDKPSEVCLKALALWRPSVREGNVREGVASVVTPAPPPEPIVEPPVRPRQRAKPTAGDEQWIGLGEEPELPNKEPATALEFPDGSSVSLDAWRHIPEQTLRWLLDRGHFGSEQCPLPWGKLRYIVSTRPVHPSGKNFKARRQVGDLWLEANASRHDHFRNARKIVEAAGMDPAQFRVRLAE